MRAALFLALALSCASAHAEGPSRYDARASLQRAQVGTYAPRAAPPVRVAIPAATSRRVERMTCRPDTLQPSILRCYYKAP